MTASGNITADSAGQGPRVTITVGGGSLMGREIVFDDRTTAIIGRALECQIRLPEEEGYRSVSRHHCFLEINPPWVRIRDLGSLNGTYLNGRTIGQRGADQKPGEGSTSRFPSFVVRPDDRLTIGDVDLDIRVDGEMPCVRCGRMVEARRVAASQSQSDEVICSECGGEPEAPATERATAVTLPAACSVCGGTMPPGTLFVRERLCDKCRQNPVAVLKALFAAAREGEPGLQPLRGMKILKSLGQGAMGAVFLAKYAHKEQTVAIKVLMPDIATNRWARESFLREVENTKALDHPNVVRLFESGAHHSLFYYTMEYCAGGNLDQIFLKRGGKLPIKDATHIILQILDGLDYIHNAELPKVKLKDGEYGQGRGLVHRDLKPSNIFLGKDGHRWLAKVADVGIGKAFDTAGLSGQTMTGTVAGSPVVTSRQQVINFKYARPDVDVWAAAATYYYILTGEYPRDFDTDRDPWLVVLETKPVPIRKRNPGIPVKLAETIDAALVDDPNITFSSARDFKAALLRAF